MCPLPAPLLPYNLPLAYLFSVGASFLVTCILLVYRWVRGTCGTEAFPFSQRPSLTPFTSLQCVLLFS